jgi:WD40 repeat protein
MTDRIGQQIGNYRLVRLLGEGGFAEVYLGENMYIGTQVAIKLLSVRVAQDDIGQFQQEARLLADLTHQHIVRVLDFGVDERTPYLIMDYAPGGSLRTRHPKGSRLPLPKVVEYVQQVAQALQYAHERKLIHRDVKPENMLIGRSGEILLSDFGIALIAQSSRYQSTKDLAGTIIYMAPEQIAGHPRTASDQYALGIVAYEWLAGCRPFQGSLGEVAVQHSVTPPPSLRAQVPELPEAVEQVIFTALAKKPEERFPSVIAFATALQEASAQALVRAPRPYAVPLSWQPKAIRLTQSGMLTLPDPPVQANSPPPVEPSASAQTSSASTIPASSVSEAPPGVSPSSAATSAPKVSRRAVLFGAVGLTTMGMVGAGAFWFMHAQTQQQEPRPQHLPFTYTGHSDTVTSVAWSPDGARIAAGSADNTVLVWNVSDGSQLLTYTGHSNPVASIAWSPDGTRIASGSWDKTVQVWNASNGNRLLTYTGHSSEVHAVAWSPDGKRIASGSKDETVQVWDASNGSRLLSYTGHKGAIFQSGDVNTVAWSPDGTRIASGSADKTVQVWYSSNGSQLLIYVGHKDDVNTVAWSPDGKRIASGSADQTVQIWDASNNSQVLTYTSNSFLTYTGHSDFVMAVAWSPDGKRIASGSADQTVQVWNANNGIPLFTYRGHRAVVESGAWSHNGKYIGSGSADKTVQVWRAP